MFKVSKKELTDALDEFYESNRDNWGQYSANIEEISDRIIHRIYTGEQPEKLYENSLVCILGAVVYAANKKVEENGVKQKEVVEKKSFRNIEKMVNGCDHTAIHRTYKRIKNKIENIDEFTLEELTDMVFQGH